MMTLKKKSNKIANKLRSVGVELAEDVFIHQREHYVEIGLYDKENDWFVFGSEVSIYLSSPLYNREPELNYGVTGAFSPDDYTPLWRTIHASSLLKNWDSVIEILKTQTKSK